MNLIKIEDKLREELVSLIGYKGEIKNSILSFEDIANELRRQGWQGTDTEIIIELMLDKNMIYETI